MIGWLLLASVLAVAASPALRTVASGLVEWEGPNGKLVIGRPTSLAVIGSFGALAFFGGASVILTSGGGAVQPPSGEISYSGPGTPTIAAVVVNDSTARLTSSAFSPDQDDTHASTIWHVDTLGGDWSALVYADTTTDSLTAQTVMPLDSGVTYKARVAHVGTNGGESVYSDSATFTPIEEAAPAGIMFACSWPTTGTSAAAITDCGDDDFSSADVTQTVLSVVSAASESLDGIPTTNVMKVTCRDRGDGCYSAWATLDSATATSPISVPSVGDTLFYSFALVVPAGFNDSDGSHPMQLNASFSETDWRFVVQNSGAGFRMEIRTFADWPNNRWCPGNQCNQTPITFTRGTTYLLELGIVRTASGAYHPTAWVCNSSGTVLYGPAQWENINGSQDLVGPPSTPTQYDPPHNWKGIVVGVNGSEPGTQDEGAAWLYWADLKIGSTKIGTCG